MFGHVTNATRADWAETALDAFMALGGTDECDGIPDLVTNLMHLQRRRDEEAGKEFNATEWATARAMMHDMEQSDDDEGDDDFCATCEGSTETRPLPCDECGHNDQDDSDDDLEEAADGETCTACHRPSIDCSRAPCPAVITDRGDDVTAMQFFIAAAVNGDGVHWSSVIWDIDDTHANVLAGAELEAGIALGSLDVAVTLHGPFIAGPTLP